MRVVFAMSLIVSMFVAVCSEDTPDEIRDKELRLTEQMAAIVHDTQGRCDQMGARLDRFMTDNAAFLRRVRTTPPRPERQVARYRARAAIVEGLFACRSNAKVTAAMAKYRALAPDAADDV